jgi:hypothetical protein
VLPSRRQIELDALLQLFVKGIIGAERGFGFGRLGKSCRAFRLVAIILTG